MKRLYMIITLMTFSLLGSAKEHKVYGPQGGLAMEVAFGEGFSQRTSTRD